MGLRLLKVGDTDREPSSDSLSVGSDEYVACPNWLGDSGVRIGSVVGSATFTIVLCSGFSKIWRFTIQSDAKIVGFIQLIKHSVLKKKRRKKNSCVKWIQEINLI